MERKEAGIKTSILEKGWCKVAHSMISNLEERWANKYWLFIQFLVDRSQRLLNLGDYIDCGKKVIFYLFNFK